MGPNTHKNTQRRQILKPIPSEALAEFVGIMMGDGGMSKYQATISLNHITDLEYSSFVSNLITELFEYTPSIYHKPEKSVLDIVMSRIEIVDFLHTLGLPIGDKIRQHLDIPDWIKQKSTFTIACIRGLIDTDGSIFAHTYISKGRNYSYKKLSFTSASESLVHSVYSLLSELGFHPRISHNGKDVRLESVADMKRYFEVISSHNPKHLNRYAS